jgi:hypothetical protein
MMTKVRMLIAVPLLFFSVPSQADELTPLDVPLAETGFSKINTYNGIAVHQDKKSEIIRVAAEGVIEVPPEQVHKAILDYKRQAGIVGHVEKSVIMESGDDWMIVYQRLNLPVISDRDVTLKVEWGCTGEAWWIRYRAVTDRGPAILKNVVRMTRNEGSWQIVPAEDGKASRVRYQMSMDLGGLVPKSLARFGADKEIPKLFEQIRRVAKMENSVNQGLVK